MSVLTEEERSWLRVQLHSKEMQCRQCQLVQRLLDEEDDG